jgi:ATP-dependent DNA helicase RecG
MRWPEAEVYSCQRQTDYRLPITDYCSLLTAYRSLLTANFPPKMSLDTPLTELAWVPPKMATLVRRLALETWRDLLEHYPRRHEDRSEFESFPHTAMDRPVCVRGRITKVTSRYFGGRKIVEAILEDGSRSALGGRIVCRWFNQYYVQRMLADGLELIVFGRPKESRNRIFIDHPEFEIVEDEEERIHIGRLTPVYPLTEGVRQRALRSLIFRAVEATRSLEVPVEARPELEAFRQVHFPDSAHALEEARKVLALKELVTMQVVVEARRRIADALTGLPFQAGGTLLGRFLERLEFRLTKAQERAIEEIKGDLATSRPMTRLLQGDVGAGKTVVAAAAILQAVEAGYQGALMAPTQVLAEQHYRNFQQLAEPLGLKLALRTGERQEESLFAADGNAQIIIGTHALLYDDSEFLRLGLVVIDEQHKFGVRQRARLLERTPVPHLLVMTATPIPRTLAMTIYGDLDVSLLDEKPADRRPIVTRIRPSAKIPEAAAFIRERINAGRQAYIIYPVIDELGTAEVKAATSEFSRWEKLLAPIRCGLLHGRLGADAKESVMAAFRAGTIQVLVATSVVEVGVDVPNATVMLIENAERFGLAQLHQLRGRIGRSEHQSYCVLLSDKEDPEALQKLAVLERSENGFEIAEADLRLRGPGDLLGVAQSGLPPLRIASLVEDAPLMVEARDIARRIMDEDPELQEPSNQRFRRILVESGKLGATLAN